MRGINMPKFIDLGYGDVDISVLVKKVITESETFHNDSPWWKRSIHVDGLNKDSIVVDIGGYNGIWSYRIAKRYQPRLFIFEPQEWCCVILKELFKDYNANIFNYGLGKKSGDFSVYNFRTDGCSFVRELGGKTRGSKLKLPVVNINDAFNEIGLSNIDVMMVNIEGGEFKLIPYMMKKNIFPKTLMFQSHDIYLIKNLNEEVSKYYTCLWDYGTPLSAWKLKDKTNA
jgi:FkbM family methyltransferase